MANLRLEAGYWKDNILAKYGAQNHWSSNLSRDPIVLRSGNTSTAFKKIFFQKVSFKGGNGLHLKFWEDFMAWDTTLKNAYQGSTK
ncbi:hypothetical protein KY290_026129 [Solanum tuberosum]|uniref:Uncharacterized protein n=1 Tax=Solanum tuberosum TaxID=4113 RepID=A0ABQ7UX74_SOLTU|nr:hypothetical protein KY289_025226 [Solanum tuberosum]KAH0673898.1 hypothetical protein KY284_024985 [Solanum tuberosum]KAH0677209.1 hypothetical protein KY285_025010 [Solanum tuberosum]KAH0755859.1 hypothetical protein KY290_026129 [Solanum tuberosum]